MAIKINPKNRGKFTSWAKKKSKTKNGKITEEAIQAGLKSKDPKIRKRANFAKQSRKWAKK